MPTIETIHAAIDKWFEEKMRTGEIGRYTPAYTQAFEARLDLKNRIAELFDGPSDVKAALVPAPPSALPVAPPPVSG